MNTILVLEDEPFVMKLLRYMLKHYSLIEATSAEEAFRQFSERGRQIDLLLADVTLPTSSGTRVALHLRSRDSTPASHSDIWVSGQRLECTGLQDVGENWRKVGDNPPKAV